MKKKQLSKVLGLIVVCVLIVACVASLASCSGQKKDTLIVAYSNFSSKFSPFFASSSYDVDVAGMTQIGLLANDRTGNIIYNGIEGETIKYNGTDYTYYGLSNLTVTQNHADPNDANSEVTSVDYKIQIRTGDKTVYFSDGQPVTIKDVIFTMYAYADKDYDGSTTFFSLPIEGMAEWRANLSTDILANVTAVSKAILASYDEEEEGYKFVADSGYTQAQFDALTAKLEASYKLMAGDIVDYCADKYAAEYGVGGNKYSGATALDFSVAGQKIAFGMAMWGFGSFDTNYVADVEGNVGLLDNGSYKNLWTRTDSEEDAAFDDVEGNHYVRVTASTQDAYWISGQSEAGYEVTAFTGTRYKVSGYADTFTDGNGNKYAMSGTDYPTLDDYATCIKDAYAGDAVEAADVETANTNFATAAIENWIAEEGASQMDGATINSITGITFSEEEGWVNVRTTEFSATTVYNLSMYVAPMHYYGDTNKWDPAHGSYGFTRGNLDGIRSKTTQPMGAGPYKFVSFNDGIVTFEANANYWEGAPKIKYVKFKEYSSDPDKLPALVKGEVDIATPSINDAVVDGIKQANGNNELAVKDTLAVATDLVDFNGYGYLGINADRIKVGEDKSSEASKNLRKAFMTLFAAYREYTVSSYYKERASVIQYPISNCSWAAPQPADAGYAIAFSKDVDGNAIYTADMTDEQKYVAAKNAALGFFEAAGYTVANGRVTAAPQGASLSYEAIIGGGGTGDHPTFALLTKASQALESIGITLTVSDMSESSTMFDKMEAGTADIFVAAWGGSSDPDMYQIYHSDNKTNSNHYRIADSELDAKIIAARKSADTAYRKGVYKECLNIILDWAVELPVYQRKECTVYKTSTVNVNTLTPDTTPYWTYLNEIHKVELK